MPTKKPATRNDKSAMNTVRSAGDERLPKPGTILEREHDGKTHRVEVMKDGFRYQGRRYTSLSSIARDITGAIWNGFAFFGLVPPAAASRPGLKKTAGTGRARKTG